VAGSQQTGGWFARRRHRREIERRVAEVPFWHHSIDLGEGVVSPGIKSVDNMAAHLALLDLPDLEGKTVLDIGAWDGFFSFEAERRGARRVVTLDHYVWSLDLQPQGVPSPETPGAWQPDTLPGKRGFDLAHELLESRVGTVVGDFMEMDLDELGVFDVVIYSGVLYHMENPLQALRRVARVTGEVAVIETQATGVPGFEHLALWEFHPSNELANDPTNWWAPNTQALDGVCRAAGFTAVEPKGRHPVPHEHLRDEPYRYRLVVHALR
jgi:tRNA (mo5U34)-methyltransferase